MLDIHAGFSKRHEDLVIDGIYEDGTVVKVHVVSYTIDGKDASSAQLAEISQAYEHPKPGEAFALPFDARYTGEYSYHEQGPGTIAFISTLHDAGHGKGTFTYDASNSVLTYTYRPNVLPPHASWGEIADRRAEVLPNYWTVTQETQHYKGSYGPFPGAATEEVDFSGFRRFSDLQSAVNAL